VSSDCGEKNICKFLENSIAGVDYLAAVRTAASGGRLSI
jgi:hypothetical protein